MTVDDALLELDLELLDILNRRAQLVSEGSDGSVADLYHPGRQAKLMREVLARNQGPIPDDVLRQVLRECSAACVASEKRLRVGYLGPEGTFTQAAVTKQFGRSARALALPSIDEVFHEAESGATDFGVAPVENSTAGTVIHTLDMFLSSSLKICGEIELPIRQHLQGSMRDLGDIRRVCAHQQSLSQCRGWLEEHLPGVSLNAVSSNAEGARRARDEAGTAAIASDAAAEVYGLRVLAPNIEDRPDNTTRFLVIGQRLLQASGFDKTTILFSTPNADGPGSLHQMLDPLARHGISMSRIESRPSRRRKWHYVFFVDLEGHPSESPMAEALQEIEARASFYRLLGAYPRANGS